MATHAATPLPFSHFMSTGLSRLWDTPPPHACVLDGRRGVLLPRHTSTHFCYHTYLPQLSTTSLCISITNELYLWFGDMTNSLRWTRWFCCCSPLPTTSRAPRFVYTFIFLTQGCAATRQNSLPPPPHLSPYLGTHKPRHNTCPLPTACPDLAWAGPSSCRRAAGVSERA